MNKIVLGNVYKARKCYNNHFISDLAAEDIAFVRDKAIYYELDHSGTRMSELLNLKMTK